MAPHVIVAYFTLFAATGLVFVFVTLLLGRLLRPRVPTPQKLETYECGEPAIGTSYVQFDLRFYVVALVFIIFDVEVAFFFPWATVFGKANQLRSEPLEILVKAGTATDGEGLQVAPAVRDALREFGLPRVSASEAAASELAIRSSMARLARTAMADMAVFFAVLLVGFAYVWRRGDLDWVRAVGQARSQGPPRSEPLSLEAVGR